MDVAISSATACTGDALDNCASSRGRKTSDRAESTCSLRNDSSA